ncbi:LacI family DNA-binding transcriptional regulator [Streptomyces jeddahensis]|uniref:LacI family DNA-binding transcriptional regulator n=1 Tax=Streptomyces jeddahensis TaxID=1716141 RepID=UPI00099025E5
MVTIADAARRAGISPSTVSHVLNHMRSVTELGHPDADTNAPARRLFRNITPASTAGPRDTSSAPSPASASAPHLAQRSTT